VADGSIEFDGSSVALVQAWPWFKRVQRLDDVVWRWFKRVQRLDAFVWCGARTFGAVCGRVQGYKTYKALWAFNQTIQTVQTVQLPKEIAHTV
jgi:hypothetical protein|tara:strand:- start:721 stop:999 length:279 start_codon:yes stop_codon:yes gene_type:complete